MAGWRVETMKRGEEGRKDDNKDTIQLSWRETRPDDKEKHDLKADRTTIQMQWEEDQYFEK